MFKFFLIAGLLCVGSGVRASSALYGVDDSAIIDAVTGIRVPPGFKATVMADKVGHAAHVAVSDNGWVYVALRRGKKGKGAVALRDEDGDGVAEKLVYFAKGIRGTGLGIYNGYLYFGTNVSILRWKLPESGIPEAKPELIVYGFGEKRQHAAKSFTFDGKGGLYVNIGAPSNACMKEQRRRGSEGMDPCPILKEYGAVWRYDADKLFQEHVKDGVRYATGIRNAVALDWNPFDDSLYVAHQGRDQLAEMFPQTFTLEQSTELPAEEFFKVGQDADLGWPYSYYDPVQQKRMLMPEYGGDGVQTSDKGQMPIETFPAHWAPHDLIFSRQEGFPDGYRKGAFVAFYGAWNRIPLKEEGYRVVFVPMAEDGTITGKWITFANGFAGNSVIKSPRDAKHRPSGIAEGPDGALYVTSPGSGGRVWKITYIGE